MGAACASCEKVTNASEIKKMSLTPEAELTCFHDFANGNLIDTHSMHGLREAFDKLGAADDNRITREEMTVALGSRNYPGNASHLFDLFDVDNSDWVTKEEFVASTKIDFIEKGPLRRMRRFFEKTFPAASYDDSLEQAFHQMDYHAGRHMEVITAADFSGMLEKQQYSGDISIAYELLDRNQNQSVTFGEFKETLHYLTRHKIMEGHKGSVKETHNISQYVKVKN